MAPQGAKCVSSPHVSKGSAVAPLTVPADKRFRRVQGTLPLEFNSPIYTFRSAPCVAIFLPRAKHATLNTSADDKKFSPFATFAFPKGE